jgi:hypothetical protein
VVRHIISRSQQFLRGHDNDISVITVSNSGKYIASGQRTHSGFQVMTSPPLFDYSVIFSAPAPTARGRSADYKRLRKRGANFGE